MDVLEGETLAEHVERHMPAPPPLSRRRKGYINDSPGHDGRQVVMLVKVPPRNRRRDPIRLFVGSYNPRSKKEKAKVYQDAQELADMRGIEIVEKE